MTKNWEKEKENMHELYMVRGMKLSDMQKVMEDKYNFKASERAYKQKFKEWRWFKKTPRSNGPDTDDLNDLDSPPRSVTPLHYQQTPQHLRYAMPQAGTYNYDPYGHSAAAYPSSHIAVPERSPEAYGMHSSPHTSTPPDTLAPIQGRPRGRLPPVSHLQLDAFKSHLREAELHAELGQYDTAQQALETAMRSLHWLKGSGM